MAKAERQDLSAALERVEDNFGMRGELKHLEELEERLGGDEEILEISGGMLNADAGILVLTSRRVVFFFHGMFHQKFQECSLASIREVNVHEGKVHDGVEIDSDDGLLDIKSVGKYDGRRFVHALRRMVPASAAAGATPPPPPAPAGPPPPPAASSPPQTATGIELTAERPMLGAREVTVDIDGTRRTEKWGTTLLEVPAGRHRLEISVRIYGLLRAKKAIGVTVPEGGTLPVRYRADWWAAWGGSGHISVG